MKTSKIKEEMKYTSRQANEQDIQKKRQVYTNRQTNREHKNIKEKQTEKIKCKKKINK